MLKAKLDSVRKNKKGFSLVELIIVIAIMVALIAVMAPAFVKYVQKSRDAALATAAEDFEKTVQTYFGDPDCEDAIPANATVLIQVVNKKLSITGGASNPIDATLLGKLMAAAGADTSKAMGTTTNKYTVTIKNEGGNAVVTMVKADS